jgi:hypothetical protein
LKFMYQFLKNHEQKSKFIKKVQKSFTVFENHKTIFEIYEPIF